jgi:outer membrane lipoprotein-sorting protein
MGPGQPGGAIADRSACRLGEDAMLLRLALGFLALLPLAAPPAHAEPGSGDAAPQAGGMQEVQECVQRNLPGTSSLQTVEMRSRDRTGSERTLGGEVKWKRLADGNSAWLMHIDSPPDVHGSAYLMIEKEVGEQMWVYLPDLKRARRIHPNTMAGSLFGTDFSYEDMKYLQRISSQTGAQRQPDVVEDGRKLYVVQVTPPAEEGSAYERVLGFVDQSSCVPLRIEFYEKGGDRVKTLSVDPDSVTREGNGWVPHALAIRDVKNESETKLLVSKVKLDADLPDRLFTVTTLERGN